MEPTDELERRSPPTLRASPWGRLATFIATGFYLSYIPVSFFDRVLRQGQAPHRWRGGGFLGTLEGLALLSLLPRTPLAFVLALTLGILGACWLSGEAERVLGRKDDPRIVIDEAVGYWVAVAFLPRSAAVLGAGFLLFRFFDAVKPPPCRRLERLPGGLGVVMDDVGAGVAANLTLRAALALIP